MNLYRSQKDTPQHSSSFIQHEVQPLWSMVVAMPLGKVWFSFPPFGMDLLFKISSSTWSLRNSPTNMNFGTCLNTSGLRLQLADSQARRFGLQQTTQWWMRFSTKGSHLAQSWMTWSLTWKFWICKPMHLSFGTCCGHPCDSTWNLWALKRRSAGWSSPQQWGLQDSLIAPVYTRPSLASCWMGTDGQWMMCSSQIQRIGSTKPSKEETMAPQWNETWIWALPAAVAW